MSWTELCPYVEKTENYMNDDDKEEIETVMAGLAAQVDEEERVNAFPIISKIKMKMTAETGKGFGIRTLENIPKDEFVMEYVGELRVGEAPPLNNRTVKLSKELYVDASEMGNAGRMINHACEGNLRLERVYCGNVIRLYFETKRKIMAGEELTFNYSFDVPPGVPNQRCNCKGPKCRLLIGSRKKKPRPVLACSEKDCGQIFKSSYLLKRHMVKHTKPEKKLFRCRKCNRRSFNYDTNRVRHENTCKKTDDKYECDVCHKLLTRKDNVENHKKYYCKGGPLKSKKAISAATNGQGSSSTSLKKVIGTMAAKSIRSSLKASSTLSIQNSKASSGNSYLLSTAKSKKVVSVTNKITKRKATKRGGSFSELMSMQADRNETVDNQAVNAVIGFDDEGQEIVSENEQPPVRKRSKKQLTMLTENNKEFVSISLKSKQKESTTENARKNRYDDESLDFDYDPGAKVSIALPEETRRSGRSKTMANRYLTVNWK